MSERRVDLLSALKCSLLLCIFWGGSAWCQEVPPEAPVLPAQAPAITEAGPEGRWIHQLELRLRSESWDWFQAPMGDSDYSFGHARLRARLGYQVPGEWEVLTELQAVQAIGIPSQAIGPGPVGQLGLGGTLFAHSNRSSVMTAGLRQAYLKVGDPEDVQFQIGRMEYSSGTQVVAPDAQLERVKKMRVKDRLLGTFDFSTYARTFDGFRLDWDSGEVHGSAFLARPTQGGFEPHFARGISDLTVAETTLTLKQGEWLDEGELQLFWNFYGDSRNVPRVDNRPAAQRGRLAQDGGDSIHTLGGHLLHKLGDQGDFLLWFAYQTGRWGNLTHRAYAFSAEAGYQWKDTDWKPWLRAGHSRFSGDSNPRDGTHTSFHPLLPTIRPYAMLPFFTESNLRDTFVQVLLHPQPQLTLRSDIHWLSLDQAADLWYVGSGATQARGNIHGYAGRPANGGRSLGTLVDIGADYQVDANHKLSAYFGHVFGGAVPGSIYPARNSSSFFFLEYNLKL